MRQVQAGQYGRVFRRDREPTGPAGEIIHPRGFLRRAYPDGQALAPDGQPRFTRVGAIAYVEEMFHRRGDPHLPNFLTVRPRLLVVHNPEARNSVPDGIWRGCPQYRLHPRILPEEGVIEYAGGWDDGRSGFD